MKKLNFKKLRRDMDAVSNELRVIRSNPDSPTQRKLRELLDTWPKQGSPEWTAHSEKYARLAKHSREYLRERMTILCSIRAQHHGRLHRHKVRNPLAGLPGQPQFKQMTVEDQVQLIAKHLKDYEQDVPAQVK